MKTKIIIASAILLIAIILVSFFYYRTTPNFLIKKDIDLFNSLTSENLNIEICETISNIKIKEKCNDNFYSLSAFKNNNENTCNKIIDSSLKDLCKKEILKFKK